jgi:hypothetical protein
MIESTEQEVIEKTETVPKWLRRVQENSWEGEILISGGAIFTLFQVSNFLAAQKVFFSENAPFMGLDEILIFSILAVEGVTFSFILHLFLRGLWISLLCVNFAFPKGINRESLRLSSRYLDPNSSLTLTSQIIWLDKMSGIIFYSGFAYVVVVLGLIATFVILIPFVFYLPGSEIILISFLLLYFLDFILGGPLRRNRTVGKIYRPIYLFYNTVTLSFLYRKTIQVVFSNVKRINALLFMFVFIPFTFALAYLSVYQVLHLPTPYDWRAYPGTKMNPGMIHITNYYLDQVDEKENIRWFAIQSEIVTGNYLKVFVTYRKSVDDGIEQNNAESFDQIVHLTLDGKGIINIDWINSIRLEADQKGLTGIVPIDALPPGKHVIELDIDADYFKVAPIKIPFWKDPSANPFR